MTYEQLGAVYNGLGRNPDGDDFNHWVQGIIDNSGSQSGTEGIPVNYFDTPNGQKYVQSTGTTAPGQSNLGSGTSSGGLNGGTSSGLSSLVQPTTDTGTFTQAPNPTVAGGNYNQVQNSTQGGQFATVGNSLQTSTGTTEQQQNGTQQQTGSQTSSGTSTSTPNDTLGFGALLKGQAGQVGTNDANRTAFLTDVMQNGGTGFGQQLDAGIRNSLTGPQMTGAGDSARARAAGYAAANVGRNNLDQRLGAAKELNAPSGLTSLVSAGTPFMGQTTTNSGTSDSISNAVNSLNTSGLSSLINRGSESQAGSTTAQSSQAGAGQIPQGQPVKTGGCVLCTAAMELKLSNHRRVLQRVIRHKLQVDPRRFHSAAKGYFAIFTPLAAWLLSHPSLARLLWPIAKAVVYEELRVSGRHLPFKAFPWAVHWIGHSVCATVGATLPVKGYVDDQRILDIARRNNILFEVQA